MNFPSVSEFIPGRASCIRNKSYILLLLSGNAYVTEEHFLEGFFRGKTLT